MSGGKGGKGGNLQSLGNRAFSMTARTGGNPAETGGNPLGFLKGATHHHLTLRSIA
jgi:hypothetical protein